MAGAGHEQRRTRLQALVTRPGPAERPDSRRLDSATPGWRQCRRPKVARSPSPPPPGPAAPEQPGARETHSGEDSPAQPGRLLPPHSRPAAPPGSRSRSRPVPQRRAQQRIPRGDQPQAPRRHVFSARLRRVTASPRANQRTPLPWGAGEAESGRSRVQSAPLVSPEGRGPLLRTA